MDAYQTLESELIIMYTILLSVYLRREFTEYAYKAQIKEIHSLHFSVYNRIHIEYIHHKEYKENNNKMIIKNISTIS